MKTLLPEPQFSFEGDWYSEAQMKAAMVAAYNEAIEDSGSLVKEIYLRGERCHWVDYDAALLKLKEQTP